jgi:hypothetical protein
MANGRTPDTISAQAKASAKIYGLRPRVPDRTPPLGPLCMFRCVVKFAYGPFADKPVCRGMSAFRGRADMAAVSKNVRL